MCVVNAVCPNCGQRDLDADEMSCFTTNGITTREYVCRVCRAVVTVVVPAKQGVL